MTSRRPVMALVAVLSVLGAALLASTTARGQGAGDPQAFCARWDEARSALLDEQLERSDQGLQDRDDVAREQLDVIDEVDPVVPDEVRGRWDDAAGFRRGLTELRFTLDWAMERVRPVHLELAFGDPDPAAAEAAEAAALAAVDEIDEWTVLGCGDLCVRWPEIERAMRFDATDPAPGPEEIVRREREHARFLELVDPLIPAELRSAWDEARAWRALQSEAVEAHPERPWEAIDRYLAERGIDANAVEHRETLDRRLEPLVGWVGATCDDVGAAGTGGSPGTLTVEVVPTDDLVGADLLVAVVERGRPIVGLERNDALLGVACAGIGNLDPAVGELVEPRGTRALCDVLGGPGGAELALLDGGSYDVVALTVTGLGPGDLTGFLPAPERCARFPVTVDGDTRVTAPPLEPCELGPLSGEPEDAPRAATHVDPSDPGAGTLTVRIADSVSPSLDDDEGGRLVAIAVPAGTTLDQIGRRETWPSGIVCTRTVTPEHLASREPTDRAELTSPVALPLTALPATGHPPTCFVPFGLSSLLERGAGPAPAVLAAGEHDLYLEVSEEVGLVGSSDSRCLSVEVTVDGDTVVEVPSATEWGACP